MMSDITKYKILGWSSLVVNSIGLGVNIYNITRGYLYCIPLGLVCAFFAASSAWALYDSPDDLEQN